MAFSLVASTKAAGLNGALTPAIDTTGAKLIVIQSTYFNTPGIAISDSKGNTWAALTAVSNGGTQSARLYYCINPTVGAGHTFTFANTNVTGSITVTAWSAASTPALDGQTGGNGSGSAITVGGGVGTLAPSQNGCLLIGGYSFGGVASGAAAAGAWTLAQNQDGAGGSHFGNGQLYLIQTTAATIAAGTAIGTSSLGGCISTSAVFREAPSDSLTITTPKQYQLFQRGVSTGSITITGSVTGATEDIEASFNGGAFATIATAVAAGSFSGTLTGQTQGQGTLTVRKKTTTSASATVADVGIGDVFLVGGDSRSEGRATNVQSYSHATLKAVRFNESDSWGLANDPVDTGTSAGSHWPLLATQIMADQSVPVAFITTGAGSTDVAGSNNQWAKPSGNYTAAVQQVTDSGVNAVKAVLMLLGPNAVVNASTLSKATYNAALDTLIANFAADLPGAPKTMIDVCGEVATGSPPDRRAALDNIRGAVIEAWGDNANALPGPCLVDQDYADGVHFASDAEELAVAKRTWIALKAALYGGSGARGPRLSSAQWNAGRNQLTVTFDRALKTGLTFASAAWIVTDNGTPMTISGIAYHGTNPAALVITTSAAAVGANGTTRLTFASGEDAKGLVVPLSTDVTVASGAAIQLPAEPIYAAVVAEATVASITITLTTDGTTPAASLTGLKWAWFDQVTPDLFAAPTDKGAVESTDGSGVLTISLPSSTKTSGQVGWLIVTNSDGTTTQSPAHKLFAGPVAVT